MYTARKAAEREHEVVETLYPDVVVPQPIDHNRHAIVMEKLPGAELANAKLDPEQATGVLDLILGEIDAAYEAGYVHADVSEYNVFVSEDGVALFDWPQAVTTDHENAAEFLRRDVENIAGYLKRKHPNAVPEIDAEAVAERIRESDFESVKMGVP
jgi:RIO kinase 2